MKKALFVAMVVTLSVMMVGSAFALISNSRHDFASIGYSFASSEICKPCHTPHNAVVDVPLWAHSTSVGPWTPYGNSATLNATISMTSTSISGLCLSCHDGTVGLGDYIGGPGGTSTWANVNANLGSDLSNDHPISFNYNTVAAEDSEIIAGAGGLPLFGTGGTDMECATCHDPHNTPGVTKLLNNTNAGSALCLLCHNK